MTKQKLWTIECGSVTLNVCTTMYVLDILWKFARITFATKGKGEENPEVWDKFYIAMCDDVKRERNRAEGKHFVVTQAVYTRSRIQPSEMYSSKMFRRQRDVIKRELGAELTFVILNIGRDLLVKSSHKI